MAISSQVLASGAGWRVSDVVCTAGPEDRPFEERHGSICMALVTDGTFQYRTAQGRALMVPGSVMLGNAGATFQCGHEHGRGDRCLAFQFAPEFLEPIAAQVAACGIRLSEPRVPPLRSLLPVLATAQAMRDGRRDGQEFEEVAVALAGSVYGVLEDTPPPPRAVTGRDERRICDAVRRIEAESHQDFSLGYLAREAAMSTFHFLRVFRQVVGVTPGQYTVRTRLHRAAVSLRTSDESISTIAYGCGFGDLSTFNRHFRRVAGVSPGAYRLGGRLSKRGRNQEATSDSSYSD